MNQKIVLSVLTLIALLMIGLSGCSTFGATSSSPANANYLGNISQQNFGLWVTGTGKMTLVPDIAQINIGVETQADTVAIAQQQAANAMETVMAALRNAGVDQKDIVTTYYNIYPVYRYDKTETILTGYRVTNSLNVKVRSINNTGKVIDDTVSAGGDAIRINGISFSVDKPEQYANDLRKLAIADADARAKDLANLAKVKLGKPTYISESGGSVPPIYTVRDEAVAGTTISTGEIEISMTVQMVYAIS